MSQEGHPSQLPTREFAGETLRVGPLKPEELASGREGPRPPVPATPARQRYVFDRLLDKGGMGEVHRVQDGDLNRPVAMKIIHERMDRVEQEMRFVDEAQITGQLDHPNIVPVYELGRTEEGRLYFTMKEVRGRSLADILDAIERGDEATCKEFTLTRILQVVLRVCEAMAFAHARSVVHRDLKPANIMVGAFGEVLVMDWGLALPLDREPLPDTGQQPMIDRQELSERMKAIRSAGEASSRISRSSSSQLTIDGAILGTPEYMPPEQAAGDRDKISPASDVYAIGACLYELLTLGPPFTDEDPYQVVEQALWSQPVPPIQAWRERCRTTGLALPRVPPALEAIVLKCLAKRRSDRYADAGELSQELHDFLEGEPVRAYADPLSRKLLRWFGKHPILTTSGVTALLLLAGFGIFWRDRSARQARQEAEQRMRSLRTEAAAMRQRNRALADQEKTQVRLNEELAEKQARAERRALALEPYNRGLEFVRRRVRWEQALAELNRAIQIDPSFAAAYLQRAEAYVMLGRIEAALADYGKVRELLSGQGVQWQLARTYLHMGNIYRDVRQDSEKAADMFRKAAAVAPESIFGRIARISLLASGHQYEEALAAIERLGKEADDYWEVHLVTGGVRGARTRKDGTPNPVFDPRKALAAYNRLIQLRPEHYLGYAFRGVLLQQGRDYTRALADLDQAIALSPRQATLYHFRGMLRGAFKRHTEALEDFTRAIELDGKNHGYLVNRGVIYTRLNKLEAALDDYKRALRIKPDDERALVYRAVTLARMQRTGEALVDYNAAIAANPRGYLGHMHRALLFRALKRYPECALDFVLALSRAPKNELPRLYYNRGQLWIETRFYDKALNDFRTAYKGGIQQALARQGQVLAFVGCFERAARMADAGMTRLDPKQANTLRRWRDYWRGQGQRWAAKVKQAPASLEVRAGQALIASFTRPVAEGRAMFKALLPELRKARGMVVWTLDAGDLLGTYARLCNEAGDSFGAIEGNTWAIAAEQGDDPATRFQIGQRRLIVASHLAKLAERASGADRASYQRRAIELLRELVGSRFTTRAAVSGSPEFRRLAATPAFRAAFGK